MEVTALAFSADGSQVVSASAKDVCIWDPATGNEIRRLKVDGEGVVGLSRDFGRLAIARSFHVDVRAARRGKLTLQETANGKEIWSIDPHGNWDPNFAFRPAITALTFTPDGKRIATAGSLTKVGGRHGLQGGVVKIWDTESGKELTQFGPLPSRADAVAFSVDGKLLAVGTTGASGELPEAGEVHVWDASTGQRLHTFKTRPDVEQGGNPGSVASLAFHPMVTLLAAGVSDGTVHLWELPSGHVYLLTVGRPPTDDEAKQVRKQFAETKDRPLSVLQLTRSLIQGKDFNAAMATTNVRFGSSWIHGDEPDPQS